MASSSSHRRGRLFGIKRKNLGEISRDFTQRHPLSQLWVCPDKITHCNWEQHDFFFACLIGKSERGSLTGNKIRIQQPYCCVYSGCWIYHGQPYLGKISILTNSLKLQPARGCLLWQFSLCSSYCITFFWVRRRAFNDCRSAPSHNYGILYLIVTACQWY